MIGSHINNWNLDADELQPVFKVRNKWSLSLSEKIVGDDKFFYVFTYFSSLLFITLLC